LYGFARYADEIVDSLDDTSPEARRDALDRWGATFLSGLDGEPIDDPLLPAVLHTIERFRLDRNDFALFLRSMAMDLTVTSYPTYAALIDYMEGSAAVIGAMMLPILGASDLVAADPAARELGRAFQLTNFIRDVGEDFVRGRIYLPQADLAVFGVTVDDLAGAVATRVAPESVRKLVAFEVARAREHYLAAWPGIALLDPGSRGCIRTAYRLYQGILDEIERADGDVFARRAVVPRRRQVAVAAASMLSSWRG
jgi:phytoene synthase